MQHVHNPDPRPFNHLQVHVCRNQDACRGNRTLLVECNGVGGGLEGGCQPVGEVYDQCSEGHQGESKRGAG